jgi:hypothetical protein
MSFFKLDSTGLGSAGSFAVRKSAATGKKSSAVKVGYTKALPKMALSASTDPDESQFSKF